VVRVGHLACAALLWGVARRAVCAEVVKLGGGCTKGLLGGTRSYSAVMLLLLLLLLLLLSKAGAAAAAATVPPHILKERHGRAAECGRCRGTTGCSCCCDGSGSAAV